MLKEENNISRIIQLLEEKNIHLEKFLLASENERRSFKARNFDNVESLYQVREDILANIRCIDQRIGSYSEELTEAHVSEKDKERIQKCMKRKERIVNEIMSQDLVIISCIENEKSSMIKRITSMKNGRRLMKAYRQMPDIID